MPEVRLIDANALYEKVDESQAHNNHQGIAHSVHNAEHAHFKYMIHQAPTIEAEPVRHGRMIEGRYPNENKCSECGQEFRDDIGFIIQDDDGVFHYPKRCPECGCYWDGGADNDSK